jgi:acetyltransferase-like isoleucine patch superfamily enzyme
MEYGEGCRFVGLPLVNIVPGSRIFLGESVSLFSRFSSNPRGVPHPTVLSAMKRGAVIEIGSNTGITGASIVSRERIAIGDWVQIGPGACVWDNDAHPLDPTRRRDRPIVDHRCAPVIIHNDVFIGARAIVLKGVTLGAGSVVGAGAVVTKTVEPFEIVAGNPARVVGRVVEESVDQGKK